MPLLYGEGDAAFIRLQEEIIKVTDDQSIFAYSPGNDLRLKHDPWSLGVFAHSASFFAGLIVERIPTFTDNPHVITNKGLRIELPLVKVPSRLAHRFPPYTRMLGILACTISKRDTYTAIAIEPTETPSVFARFNYDPVEINPEEAMSAHIERIYLRRTIWNTVGFVNFEQDSEKFCINVDWRALEGFGFVLKQFTPIDQALTIDGNGTGMYFGTKPTRTLPAVLIFYNEVNDLAFPIVVSCKHIWQSGEVERRAKYARQGLLQVLNAQLLNATERRELTFLQFADKVMRELGTGYVSPGTTVSAARASFRPSSEFLSAMVLKSIEVIASISTHKKLDRSVFSINIKCEEIRTFSPDSGEWPMS